METVLPAGSLQMRSIDTATSLKEGLLQGMWSYPSTTVGPGHWNLSIIAFDVPFFVLLFLGGFLLMGTSMSSKYKKGLKNLTDNEETARLMEFCTNGGLRGQGEKWRGMNRYVAFAKLEQVILWVCVLSMVAFVALKILCGAKGVNSGSVLIVLIVGFMTKYFRQGAETGNVQVDVAGKTKKEPPKSSSFASKYAMAPTLIALFATIITFIAYTDCIGTTEVSGVEGGKKAGQNSLYIWAGITAFVAMLWKMALTLLEDTHTDDNVKTQALFKALVNDEFMYYMTGWDCVVLTITMGTFVLLESCFVAYAATAYYAAPFYLLLALPLYFAATNIVHVATNNSNPNRTKLTVGPLFFNILLSTLGAGIILLSQFQVCSMPHPSKLEHVGKACYPYGLHFNKDNDLKMRETPVVMLGCISSLFLLLVMAGTQYTNGQIVRTVNDVCTSTLKPV